MKSQTQNKLDNMIWHIENNRKVLGDERTLDGILQSLKIWAEEERGSNE